MGGREEGRREGRRSEVATRDSLPRSRRRCRPRCPTAGSRLSSAGRAQGERSGGVCVCVARVWRVATWRASVSLGEGEGEGRDRIGRWSVAPHHSLTPCGVSHRESPPGVVQFWGWLAAGVARFAVSRVSRGSRFALALLRVVGGGGRAAEEHARRLDRRASIADDVSRGGGGHHHVTITSRSRSSITFVVVQEEQGSSR